MESLTLGKRPRSLFEDAPALSTRSKRRSLRELLNDENERPLSADETEAQSLPPNAIDRIKKHSKQLKVPKHTVPAKHGAPERRVASSPTKIIDHFKSTKSVEIYQDTKALRTPTAPRYRDALNGKIPVTPRHRVVLNAQQTPRTPTSSHSKTSVYNLARRLFSRCSHPGRLVGRDNEREEALSFVRTCVENQSGGCLYVSGPPGTGKSALINEVLEGFPAMKQSLVNCMSVRNTKELGQKLCADLELDEDADLDRLQRSIFETVNKSPDSCLIILDEVDRLVDLDLELLYRLFEWSLAPDSKLILVGIANALDLTDRFLPRLKSRSLRPVLLPFMPYNATQIVGVLTAKLRSLHTDASTELPFIHPAALQFCARKVAAQTGDLRKAFDICKRAIDLVEQEMREKILEETLQASPSKSVLVENINLSSPVSPQRHAVKATAPFTLSTAPKVSISHMAKVTAQAFSNGASQRLSTLNLQQKAVLCSLATLEKKRRQNEAERTVYATPSKTQSQTAPTVKQLFEAYSALCKRDQILHPLTSTEFRDVVSGLETLGLVSQADGRNGSLAATPITPSRAPGRRSKVGAFGAIAVDNDEKRVASVIGFQEVFDSLTGAGADLLKEIVACDPL